MSSFWSYDAVQERLVEAVRLCWRDEPGRWPFASDGPWNLITPDNRTDNDMDAWRQMQEAADALARRPLPLSRAEVGRRDQAIGWLSLIGEGDRRIVVLAARQIAAGAKRVSWAKLRRDLVAAPGALEIAISDRGLGARYSRAVAALARRLTADRVTIS